MADPDGVGLWPNDGACASQRGGEIAQYMREMDAGRDPSVFDLRMTGREDIRTAAKSLDWMIAIYILTGVMGLKTLFFLLIMIRKAY